MQNKQTNHPDRDVDFLEKSGWQKELNRLADQTDPVIAINRIEDALASRNEKKQKTGQPGKARHGWKMWVGIASSVTAAALVCAFVLPVWMGGGLKKSNGMAPAADEYADGGVTNAATAGSEDAPAKDTAEGDKTAGKTETAGETVLEKGELAGVDGAMGKPGAVTGATHAGAATVPAAEAKPDSTHKNSAPAVTKPGQTTAMVPQLPAAGQLTAGEWNDNDHFDFWKNLINGQSRDWAVFRQTWGIVPLKRSTVTVKNTAGKPLENTTVTLYAGQNVLFSGKTDNRGMVYLFWDLLKTGEKPDRITAVKNGVSKTVSGLGGVPKQSYALTLNTDLGTKALDLMFVIDTTGSMGDELSYLQSELISVVKAAKNANGNLATRLSVNCYRDKGDEYVVRPTAFTTDLTSQLTFLRQQNSNGGGDTPEAVHTALDNALNAHKWDENATKLLFLVLDAPPHADQPEAVAAMQKLTVQAAQMGVRIIPVIASGSDTSNEYLMRSMALVTGGTYTFLTNDSGIGGGHLAPTVGSYTVKPFNQLLLGLINRYLK